MLRKKFLALAISAIAVSASIIASSAATVLVDENFDSGLGKMQGVQALVLAQDGYAYVSGRGADWHCVQVTGENAGVEVGKTYELKTAGKIDASQKVRDEAIVGFCIEHIKPDGSTGWKWLEVKAKAVAGGTFEVADTFFFDPDEMTTVNCIRIQTDNNEDIFEYYVDYFTLTEVDAAGAAPVVTDDSKDAPAPTTGNTAAATDPSKAANPETGVEGVAAVAGLAIVAAGAILFARKK